MSRHASAAPAERHLIEKSAYRLRQWPQFPERFRTAPVLRAFSRMSVGPVTGRWFLGQTGLCLADAAELLGELTQQQAIDSIPFDIHPLPQAPVGDEPRQRAARRWRLALKEVVVAALACLALAAPGGEPAASYRVADLATTLGG
jgi:hypothetical protein